MLYNKANLDVAKFASTEASHPEISSVLFTETGTVATDSFTLVSVPKPTDDPKEFPVIPGTKTPAAGTFNVLLDAKQVAKIKTLKNRDLPILENVSLSDIDGTQATLTTTDLIAADNKVIRKTEGEYPKWKNILPDKSPVIATALVNPEYLARIALYLAGTQKEFDKNIKIEFYGTTKPIKITAKSAKNGEILALLMPIKE